ncbi:MAG: hypothetical protein J6I50_11915 [Clostridia bacterium]|nr:hypothetical protein [Clostridia bacterium]
MNHSKRTAAWLLSILSIASVLASCGGDTAKDEVVTDNVQKNIETTAADETAELTELEMRQRISDNLPDKDWGGKEFRIVTSEEFDVDKHLWVEEQNGDQCNDAVYKRNEKIESRFNTKIVILPQGTNRDMPTEVFKKAVIAGDDSAELYSYVDYMAYKPVGADCCYDWTEIPHIDLTQPWHNKLANDGATINGKLFTICSDLSVSSMTYTYAIFFNTRLAANYDMDAEYLYGLVKNGEWTIDKFIELTKDLYADNNGDGKKDENDTYGFGYQITNPADVWLTAFDQPLTKVNADGTLSIDYLTEKTDSALQKLRDYQGNSQGFFTYTTQYDEEKFFANGTLVFSPMRFDAAFKALRDMTDVYSMLPYPKWDTAQENYYTNADDKFQVFSVPVTASNTEFVGMIYEALCAESYRSVYPAYYDVALKGKYSSDQTTAEIIDLIMSGRKFDVSFQFGEQLFARLPYLFRDMLLSPNKELASNYATVEKKILKKIDQFYELFAD